MATFWKNVQVSMQSAAATAVSITGITQASPGVVSHSGTDPSDGDYVLLEVSGMNKVNKRVVRVANQAVGTFELEGIDTTNYTAFSSGTFKVLTLGSAFSTMTEVTPQGGESEKIDLTTIHDSQRVEALGVKSAFSVDSTLIYDNSDATHIAAAAASEADEEKAFMIQFSNSSRLLWYGYVSMSNLPGGQAQGVVTTPISISSTGLLTSYAT